MLALLDHLVAVHFESLQTAVNFLKLHLVFLLALEQEIALFKQLSVNGFLGEELFGEPLTRLVRAGLFEVQFQMKKVPKFIVFKYINAGISGSFSSDFFIEDTDEATVAVDLADTEV